MTRLWINYPSIGHKNIYWAETFFGVRDEVSEVPFHGHIRGKTQTADFPREPIQCFFILVTETYPGVRVHKPSRQGRADPAGASSDNHCLAREIHCSNHELRERFIIGDIAVTEPCGIQF